MFKGWLCISIPSQYSKGLLFKFLISSIRTCGCDLLLSKLGEHRSPPVASNLRLSIHLVHTECGSHLTPAARCQVVCCVVVAGLPVLHKLVVQYVQTPGARVH